jgi:hypothetical protein
MMARPIMRSERQNATISSQLALRLACERVVSTAVQATLSGFGVCTPARTRIVEQVPRWSQPRHGDARPDSDPAAISTAQSLERRRNLP